MDISKTLGQILKAQRERKGLTLAKLSYESKVAISTLNAIENGTVQKVKDMTFQKITSALKISPEQYDEKRLAELRVGFGACLWAAPLLSAIVKESTSEQEKLDVRQLILYCYSDAKGEPIQLERYNQEPNEKENRILTANETLSLLQEGKLDVAFLPVETSERAIGIVRIARSMNTVRGGLYLLIIGKVGDDILNNEMEADRIKRCEIIQKIEQILHDNDPEKTESCCFVFPLNSIAQFEINSTLFENTYFSKYAIEFTTPDAFDKQMKDRIHSFFNNDQARFFIYAGWDYNVFRIEQLVKNMPSLICKEFYSYEFSKIDRPFAQVSYDCVTHESKYDYLKEHPGLENLFTLVSENIKALNILKQSNYNPKHRLIAKFLNMDIAFVNNVLKQINWEFLIYPEFYDRNLR